MAKILIIDDDEQILNMLSQTLKREGFEVKTAINGNVGMEQIQNIIFDVVITDLIMPEKEGIETITNIRKEYPYIKIIAISGGSSVEPSSYLKTAQMLGAHFTFTKPVDKKKLIEAIKTLLN